MRVIDGSPAGSMNMYINFALHAVYGRLGEADTLMRVAGDHVRRVADFLSARCPVAPRPIYRGMLLDPTVTFATCDTRTFASWSEDRDVATWFASTASTISAPLVDMNPRLRGFVVEAQTPPARVLFHHAWADAFDGLAHLALLHPFMGEGGRQQIAWSLSTQREVITEPARGLVPRPADVLTVDELTALERRLTPPWVSVDAQLLF